MVLTKGDEQIMMGGWGVIEMPSVVIYALGAKKQTLKGVCVCLLQVTGFWVGPECDGCVKLNISYITDLHT